MSEQKFPAGWDAERVERLLGHYEQLSEEEQVAEDEEAAPGLSGVQPSDSAACGKSRRCK